MITAGDERLKTQSGNNNAYCQDNIITWQHWDEDAEKDAFFATVSHLIGLRKSHPVLRPESFTHEAEPEVGKDQVLWFKGTGAPMSVDEDWHNPERRTMQRLSLRKSEVGLEAMLLVINGREAIKDVVLPEHEQISSFDLLWDSALETPSETKSFSPGEILRSAPTSMQLLVATTKG